MNLQRFAEKSFAPTPHKLRQAREQGQVASSPDLSGSLVLVAIALLLGTLAPAGVRRIADLMRDLLSQAPPDDLGVALHTLSIRWLSALALIAAPALAVALVAGVGSGLAQTGFSFTLRLAAPDLSRLSPARAASRVFSKRGAIELLKRLLKLILIAWLGYTGVRDLLPLLPALVHMPVAEAAARAGQQALGLLQRLAFTMLALGAADYAYQRWQHIQDLRMTREEMKQEAKEQETSPELRQRVRKRQRELLKRRMIQAVPKASVVVTNPTHFAAALRYDAASMAAPRLVAKGQDALARRIRQVAGRAGVPVVENPPLARALYAQVPLDAEIPPELYQAVAEVLAYVYRTRRLPAPAPAPGP